MSSTPADRSASSFELAIFTDVGLAVHPLPRVGRVSIGRSRENDICVDHRSVSRRHAVLHLGSPPSIEDLGSANGTSVRAAREAIQTEVTHEVERISGKAVEVAPGDRITIGSVVVVLRRSLAGGDLRAEGGERAFVARDPAMIALYQQAERAARGTISVLLLGETGVGKEVMARAIHARSPRASQPFLGINCAALAESLFEAELFGHEKGAFTGAAQARPGLFEAASGGSVFLDEVGELPLSTQAKLLRVIEERQVLRVGARTPRPVDVRFISATNRDLEALSIAGSFRRDLFFRLNGIAFVIPPLRERPADIAPLARYWADHAYRQLERPEAPVLTGDVLARLERHAWPGNIRELRNVLERAAVLCPGAEIGLEHLPTALSTTLPPPSGVSVQEAERRRILEALDRFAGNQTQAAAAIGISRRTLINRIEEYGIPRPRKKGA